MSGELPKSRVAPIIRSGYMAGEIYKTPLFVYVTAPAVLEIRNRCIARLKEMLVYQEIAQVSELEWAKEIITDLSLYAHSKDSEEHVHWSAVVNWYLFSIKPNPELKRKTVDFVCNFFLVAKTNYFGVEQLFACVQKDPSLAQSEAFQELVISIAEEAQLDPLSQEGRILKILPLLVGLDNRDLRQRLHEVSLYVKTLMDVKTPDDPKYWMCFRLISGIEHLNTLWKNKK